MPYAYSNCNWFRTAVTLSKIAHYFDTTNIAAACVGCRLMADIGLTAKRLKLDIDILKSIIILVDCFKQFKATRIVI